MFCFYCLLPHLLRTQSPYPHWLAFEAALDGDIVEVIGVNLCYKHRVPVALPERLSNLYHNTRAKAAVNRRAASRMYTSTEGVEHRPVPDDIQLVSAFDEVKQWLALCGMLELLCCDHSQPKSPKPLVLYATGVVESTPSASTPDVTCDEEGDCQADDDGSLTLSGKMRVNRVGSASLKNRLRVVKQVRIQRSLTDICQVHLYKLRSYCLSFQLEILCRHYTSYFFPFCNRLVLRLLHEPTRHLVLQLLQARLQGPSIEAMPVNVSVADTSLQPTLTRSVSKASSGSRSATRHVSNWSPASAAALRATVHPEQRFWLDKALLGAEVC